MPASCFRGSKRAGLKFLISSLGHVQFRDSLARLPVSSSSIPCQARIYHLPPSSSQGLPRSPQAAQAIVPNGLHHLVLLQAAVTIDEYRPCILVACLYNVQTTDTVLDMSGVCATLIAKVSVAEIGGRQKSQYVHNEMTFGKTTEVGRVFQRDS